MCTNRENKFTILEIMQTARKFIGRDLTKAEWYSLYNQTPKDKWATDSGRKEATIKFCSQLKKSL